MPTAHMATATEATLPSSCMDSLKGSGITSVDGLLGQLNQSHHEKEEYISLVLAQKFHAKDVRILSSCVHVA